MLKCHVLSGAVYSAFSVLFFQDCFFGANAALKGQGGAVFAVSSLTPFLRTTFLSNSVYGGASYDGGMGGLCHFSISIETKFFALQGRWC